MKKLVIYSVFGLFLVSVMALSAPRARAMVIVKNYTRYSSEHAYEYNDTYSRVESSRLRFESADKRPETGPYKGWKSIFNIFF